MKTVKLLAVCLLLSQMHCKQDEIGSGEPIVWNHYYVFVDDEGNNFFEANVEYSPEGVTHDNFNELNPHFFLSSSFISREFSSKEYENYNIFESDTWTQEKYISFGNGDVDTLTPSWSPSHLSRFDFFRNEFESFSYYYNGELIETWDFTAKSGLDQQQFLDSIYAGTPYIIEIPKTADPDEFVK